jgi:sRNA-binding regulator protein Hfq
MNLYFKHIKGDKISLLVYKHHTQTMYSEMEVEFQEFFISGQGD